jgi:hypothetical protein
MSYLRYHFFDSLGQYYLYSVSHYSRLWYYRYGIRSCQCLSAAGYTGIRDTAYGTVPGCHCGLYHPGYIRGYIIYLDRERYRLERYEHDQ